MENILSTVKGEYSKTILLIIIPGALAFFPFAALLQSYFRTYLDGFDKYAVYSVVYLLASFFTGFIIQDIGSRIEVALDHLYCKISKEKKDAFDETFRLYLLNERKEEFIVTHYYRSMLVRFRFELHTCAAIIILLIGSLVRCGVEDFNIDIAKTWWFVSISFVVLVYLVFEAYQGVATLHFWREKINEKFKPTY